jgi:hypothetical protein
MNISNQLRDALDPVQFAINQLGFQPDPWQEDFLKSTDRQILVNAARQAGKSSVGAIAALHRALFYPESTVLLVSPYMKQSKEIYRKLNEFRSRMALDYKLLKNTEESLEFANKSRVVCLSGDDLNIRSYSADLIIEDEASRVDDRVYLALRPMTISTGGRIVLLSTPYGSRGHFFEEWMNGGDDWKRIKVVAEECPRFNPKDLERDKRSMPEWWYRQEFYGEFLQRKEQLFSYEEVMGAISNDIEPMFERSGDSIIILWDVPKSQDMLYSIGLDLGMSVDHSAVVVVQYESLTKVHNVVYHQRFPLEIGYPRIIDAVCELYHLTNSVGQSCLLIDQTGVGHPIFESFRKKGLGPIGVNITSGVDEVKKSMKRYNVPKRNLVDSLKVILQERKLRIAAGISHTDYLIEELLNFELRYSQHGNDIYGSSRHHDDLVVALMLPLWFRERDPWYRIKFLHI